ncbi:SRPBCC family protein [Pseudomonas sp. ICMP 460]|uniref:SRPBCC family protein n=1 Tax=Pseudomonas sp. ICMP 460 TaxID=1718917 RepID=UPI000C0820C1|nr:SRPBCC family protein [Pseudomonas sp. ICMP 460]PHN24764.1 polyketide cyclase [Pseudomonas sp. ICMP 460]
MAKVEYSAVVDGGAERVWDVLKRFGKISQWHPAIPQSVIEDGQPDGLVGCIRRLTLQDGAILREQLLSVDAVNLQFSYRFVEAPLPVDNYVLSVRLIPLTGEQTTVILWSATFDTREPDPRGQWTSTIESLIVGGHESLQVYLNQTATA